MGIRARRDASVKYCMSSSRPDEPSHSAIVRGWFLRYDKIDHARERELRWVSLPPPPAIRFKCT